MRKKEILAICDQDLSYLEHLSDYLNRQTGFPYQADPFTELSALITYAKEHMPQVAVVSRSLAEQMPSDERLKKIPFFCLTEEEEEDGVCRYQSCDELQRQIFDKCRLMTGKEAGTERIPPAGEETSCMVIGVYSPVSRCGKTSFAAALAMELAGYDRTVCINLEFCSGQTMLFSSHAQNDLTDLLYGCRSGDGRNFAKVLQNAVIAWDEADCICPARIPADLYEVSREEWNILLKRIAEDGSYAYMVLDIGNGAAELIPMLENCARIYMPVLNDRISQGKVLQFEQMLETLGETGVRDAIRKIAVPRLRSDGEPGEFPAGLSRGKIGSYARQIILTDELIRAAH